MMLDNASHVTTLIIQIKFSLRSLLSSESCCRALYRGLEMTNLTLNRDRLGQWPRNTWPIFFLHSSMIRKTTLLFPNLLVIPVIWEARILRVWLPGRLSLDKDESRQGWQLRERHRIMFRGTRPTYRVEARSTCRLVLLYPVITKHRIPNPLYLSRSASYAMGV